MAEVSTALDRVVGIHPLDTMTTEQVGDYVSGKEIQAAYALQEALKRDKRKFIQISFDIAQKLKKVRDNRWYKVLGYASFDEWTESPEIDIDRSSAYRYMNVYEVYVESGAYDIEELEDKSMSKLEILIPYIDPEREDWEEYRTELLGHMDLSRRDLVNLLNEQLEDSRYAPQVLPLNPKSSKAVDVIDVDFDEEPRQRKEKVDIADATFNEMVKAEKRQEREEAESVPVVEVKVMPMSDAKKEIGLGGWYELVPLDEAPKGKGRQFKCVTFTASKVLVQGARILANIE